MSFATQMDLARDQSFRDKCRIAMATAAKNIQAETANSLCNLDAAAAATSLTVVNGAVFAVNNLVQIGSGATMETRKITAIAANVLTVSALTNAHKAGEVVQTVVYNHINRSNYAKLVLNDIDSYVGDFAVAVASNPAITTASTDAAIQNEVNASWDSLAGII